jgi:adenosine deaminase
MRTQRRWATPTGSRTMLRRRPHITKHNIRRLHQTSLCVSVNSDSRSHFGGYIDENFTPIQLAHNGFTSAFLST